MRSISTTVLAVALAASFAAPAYAHGEAKQGKKEVRQISDEEKDFGREGDPKKVSRTVKVGMGDNMRFVPGNLTIKKGETVKFVASNGGKLTHEMVLGTMKDLKEHSAMMKMHPTMEHDEPFIAHVAPGATGTLVWQFTKAGEFYYGCLVPGHFEAGMVGRITVTPQTTKGNKS